MTANPDRTAVQPMEPERERVDREADESGRMVIVAEGLKKSYRSGGRPLTVLEDVDVAVEKEGFVAVVGPSGSGKTTLLGLLAGLDRPTEGTVRLDGIDLSTLTEDGRARFRAKNVGFVFQTFQLLPTLTAVENVLVPLELRGEARTPDGTPIRDRCRALLERVGLGDREDHYPAQLSGGEQQRVAVARAFANRPKILFADEPTGNLDRETGGTVIDRLVELNREERTTMLLVTHDEALARRAHRIVRLSGGRVVADETQDRTDRSSHERQTTAPDAGGRGGDGGRSRS